MHQTYMHTSKHQSKQTNKPTNKHSHSMRTPPKPAILLTTLTLLLESSSDAFLIRYPAKMSTKLLLEDWVADMIDDELYRQAHRKEYEQEWMEKNRAAVFHRMETDFGFVANPDASDFRVYHQDKSMAEKDPQKYCADRCVATGNCDIYEDFFEMGPEEVVQFCTNCVLSEEEEPCDIPDGFYDKLMP